jgi:uncharacterized protein (TIGR00730 family)
LHALFTQRCQLPEIIIGTKGEDERMKDKQRLKLSFRKGNTAADREIDKLISLVGGIDHPGIIREMIVAALKAGQEQASMEDLRLMNYTMKEMRFTAKIFGPYKKVRKVTIFGSARTKSDELIYDIARELGRRLAAAGFMVITGAGGGIMQAANEGAGPEHSFGVNITLPFEQSPNPVLAGSPRLINYRYFFNRKVAFVKECDAVALFPGGFGTLDEAMEVLTLLQNGKHSPIPLLLIDEPGGTYWLRWEKLLKHELLPEGYINESDFFLFELVDSVEEAVEKTSRFYRRYHSLRYVGGKLVLRLSLPLEEHHVDKMRIGFKDILSPGGEMLLSPALSEESDEPGIGGLQRLVVDFNRKDFGRLRKLIDEVNII